MLYPTGSTVILVGECDFVASGVVDHDSVAVKLIEIAISESVECISDHERLPESDCVMDVIEIEKEDDTERAIVGVKI